MSDRPANAPDAAAHFLDGGGEMGALMRAFDWSATPLGPAAQWPQGLRAALSICLNAHFPIAICWGPDYLLLCNDSWRRTIIGAESPSWSLGRSAWHVQTNIWDVIAPLLASVWATGLAVSDKELALPTHRDGCTEAMYFACSFSPIKNEQGAVEGVFAAFTQTAAHVHNGRHTGLPRELPDVAEHRRVEESLRASEQRFARFMQHLPGLAWLKDLDGRYVYANDAAERAFRTPRAELYGKTDDEIFPLTTAAQFRHNDRQALASETGIQTVESLEHEDGILHHSLVSKFPILGVDGKVGLIGGMAIDITGHRQAEERLRESEHRFRQLAENIQAVFWMADARGGNILYVSPAYETIWGRSCQSLYEQPQSFLDGVHRDDRAQVVAILEKQDRGEATQMEYRVIRSDGTVRWVHDRGFPIRDETGQIGRIAGIAEDITERKLAEEQIAALNADLRRSLEELQTLLKVLPVGIFIAQDAACTKITMNPAGATMLRLPLDANASKTGPEASRLPFRVLKDGVEVQSEELPMQRAGRTGRPVAAEEIEVVYADGTAISLYEYASPLFDESGQVRGCLGVFVDFTDRKRVEEALRQSEERFRFLTETIPSIVWMAAPDGTLLYANRRWLEYCGLTPEQNAHNWPELVFHPDDHQRCVTQWNQALGEGKEYEVEVRNRRHDGVYRWFISRAMPWKDSEGRVVCWFGVTTDIHDQKMTQEQLLEADRRKDEFLATLAHELRNPLAPIRNALHLLRMPGADARVAGRVHEMMERQVSHLVRLVDDLLEVSRITRGKIELRRERVELAAVVASAVETSRPLIEAAGQQLVLSLPPAPPVLEADAVRLAQVIANLLNNAAKYTPERGRIWLTVWQEGAEVVLSVRDDGVGIPADMLPRVFDMFAQVDHTFKRVHGGLGIGLTLARSLVQLHGGSIEAHSDGPGKGSEFTVRLPLPPEQRLATSAQPGENGQSLGGLSPNRILVVDDNCDAADSLGMLLSFLGADAQVVYDGPSALEAVRACLPAVVLLDIGMPGMDGHEVARRLRQQPEFQDIVIIALTGWGHEDDRRRSRAAGFDHHLVKPVDVGELRALLASLGTDISSQ